MTGMTRTHKTHQRRWKCPDCGAEGWETGHEKISPLFDHDTPSGRRCRKAEAKGLAGKQAASAYDFRKLASAPTMPRVGLNGTPGPRLVDQLDEAVNAVRAAESALENTEPNGRDYPGGTFAHAQSEYRNRLLSLQRVRAELEAIWESVQGQIDAQESAQRRQ